MATQVGVLIPTREAIMSGRPDTDPLLAMADRAEHITAEHSLQFCEGRGTQFEKLYDLDAYTLREALR